MKPPDPENYRLGEWLRSEGPDADIAICTRVRLARNVQGYSFSPRMSEGEAREFLAFAHERLAKLRDVAALHVVDLQDAEDLYRLRLMERHLISRDHATSRKPRSVAVNEDESVSVMVNEEDHLRSQVFLSGFRVEDSLARAEAIDKVLIDLMPLAFSEEFGFLTTCPTNTGTGLRVSVMLHLPGLIWSGDLEKVNSAAQRIHLAMRGLYGEGSRALGDFYQISNQVTLGRSEDEIMRDVTTAVGKILEMERDVRSALLEGNQRIKTLDRVHRAIGTLERAHILSSEETLTSLSAVRFGVQQGLFPHLTAGHLNRALLLSQPAHLQWIADAVLDPEARDVRRAELVQQILASN